MESAWEDDCWEDDAWDENAWEVVPIIINNWGTPRLALDNDGDWVWKGGKQ